MNNISSCCDDTLGLPVGQTGANGTPSFLALSQLSGALSLPYTTPSVTFIEVTNGRFIFSNTFSTPFKSLKANVYVSGGVGSLTIVDLISANTLYTNSNITSTSSFNIESAIGLNIYNVPIALISVQVKADVGQTISIASISFAY